MALDGERLGRLALTLGKAGARELAKALPGGALIPIALDVLGEALGVDPTPEAVAEAVDKGAPPERIAAAENAFVGRVAEIRAQAAADLQASESARESPFSWAWRPAMSWLLIVLWTWALLILPTLKAVAVPALQPIPMDNLTSFTGLWLAIYGGGNTIKSIWGRAK